MAQRHTGPLCRAEMAKDEVVDDEDKVIAGQDSQDELAAIRAALSRKELPQDTREWLVSRMASLESGRKEISNLKYIEAIGMELNAAEKLLCGEESRQPRREQDPQIITVFVSDPNTGKKLPVEPSISDICIV